MLNTKIYKLFYKILGINIIVVENLFSMNLMKYNKIHYENIVNLFKFIQFARGSSDLFYNVGTMSISIESNIFNVFDLCLT